MASYQSIIEDLCRRIENSESPDSLRKVLQKHEASGIGVIDGNENSNENSNENNHESNPSKDKIQDQEPVMLLPFHPRGLTDLLVSKLMQITTEKEIEDEVETEASTTISSTQAMHIAKALVGCLPGVYLHALATSVSDLIASVSHESISISSERAPGLLRLWVSLIVQSPLQVHELLSESLLVLLGKQNEPDHAKNAMEFLVQDWKLLLCAGTGKSNEAVRCAVVLVKWVSRLPQFLSFAQSSGAADIFVEMLGDFDDPLQQLSILDALIQEFDHNNNNTSTSASLRDADEWLSSPPLMSLVLQFLKDPLLSDAALQYVGVLSSVRPTEMQIVLDHVQQVAAENGGDIPTRDTERLPLVNALSTLAMSSSSETGLNTILKVPLLRRSWWDTDRIAQPKLKAAILVSVAQALPVVEESFGATKALELYKLVGEDHRRQDSMGDTTTFWLLSKMANSPLIEVKIASLALLAAAIRLQNAALVLLGVFDPMAHASLLELLLSSKREATVHAQSARYDLLMAFWEAIEKHPSLEENPKVLQKLREKRALGPHGQKPLQYGSDEMETA